MFAHECTDVEVGSVREKEEAKQLLGLSFAMVFLPFLLPLRNLSPIQSLGNLSSSNSSGICLKSICRAFRSVEIELSTC